MATTGRNDPCPCGSGKKYKACCLEKGESARHRDEEPGPEAAPTLRSRVMDNLVEFGERSYQRVFKEGRNLYLRLDDFSEEGLEEEDLALAPLDEREEFEWLERMMDGVLFDLPAGPDGEVIAAAYLRRMSSRLADDEKAWLLEMLDAPLTPFELVEVKPGEGFRARDLWTGEERFISEPFGSDEVGVGHLFAARVTRESERFVFEGGPYSFPVDARPALEAEMAKYLKENGAASVGDLAKPLLRRFSIVLHALWNELVLDEENPFGPDSQELRARLGLDHLDSSHREWVDLPLPALDGQTPRAAARSSEGRTQLVSLLALAEARVRSAVDPGHSTCDFGWIRKELRLPAD